MMNIITHEFNFGLSAPVTILHTSDTHLTLADDRDDERKLELAKQRSVHFKNAERYLCDAAAYAKEQNADIVHTGDLIDFVSYANIDRARKFTDETGCLMAAGNHEFSLYVGEAFEDAAYRAQSYDRVQAAFDNNIRFASREKNGLNMVVIDNGYYLFDKCQLDALKKEVEKGLPVLLFMHCPLYAEDLYGEMMKKSGGKSAVYQVAVPPEKMTHYDEYRLRQQTADEVTLETVGYIKSQPLIKAIFAGHLHTDHISSVTPSLTQYVTGIPTIRKIIVR